MGKKAAAQLLLGKLWGKRIFRRFPPKKLRSATSVEKVLNNDGAARLPWKSNAGKTCKGKPWPGSRNKPEGKSEFIRKEKGKGKLAVQVTEGLKKLNRKEKEEKNNFRGPKRRKEEREE